MNEFEIKMKICEYEHLKAEAEKIHCPLVAAKYQRWIDGLKKTLGDDQD